MGAIGVANQMTCLEGGELMNNPIFEQMRRVSLNDPERFKELIEEYLYSGPHQAHLFTINGLTWPIHRDLCFLAVPDPHEVKNNNSNPELVTSRSKRRYSMLSYLYNTRPGDLVFFFQADPQRPRHTVIDRRGFRGIYIIASSPFKDTSDVSYAGYEELGKCPHCGFSFDFGAGDLHVRGRNSSPKKCPWCGRTYGTVTINGETYSKVVLPLRILTRPLVVFEKTAGDTRVYGDMEIPPLLWISRSDNSMGAGKGSSIRTLLPEEAGKIAYMLATEPNQQLLNITCNGYTGIRNPITDHNGVEVHYPRLDRQSPQKLEHELHLNLYISRVIDNPNHPLIRLLGINPAKLIYRTTEFPWGYTGDTSDFVSVELDGNQVKIYLFEFKKDALNKKALAEVLLYAPWVARVVLNAMPSRNVTEIKVIPILIGSRISSLGRYAFRALPQYTRPLNIRDLYGRHISLEVGVPVLITYTPVSPSQRNGIYYASDLRFSLRSYPVRQIPPIPPTFAATEVEKEHVVARYLRHL